MKSTLPPPPQSEHRRCCQKKGISGDITVTVFFFSLLRFRISDRVLPSVRRAPSSSVTLDRAASLVCPTLHFPPCPRMSPPFTRSPPVFVSRFVRERVSQVLFVAPLNVDDAHFQPVSGCHVSPWRASSKVNQNSPWLPSPRPLPAQRFSLIKMSHVCAPAI